VILGLTDGASVSRAATDFGGAVLVAAQLRGGIEVFCGMTRDPDVGPVLAVGLGGVAVEHMPGAKSCVAPITLEEARRLVSDSTAISRALSPQALDAVAGVLVALGRIALEHPEISAVDVNPLIAGEHGAVAVDALVVVGP
jgi:hypothetical protein